MKDVDAAVRRLRRQGYTVTRGRKSSHWLVRDDAGRLLASISSTTGDRKSLRYLKGQIRRAEARP